MNNSAFQEQPKMSVAMAASFLGTTVQGVHKQLKSRNIPFQKLNKWNYVTFESAREWFGIDFKRKKIAGQIVKGGTGKTTAIDNIASCANIYGARVLIVDADPQGNITDVNGVDSEEYPVLLDAIKDPSVLIEDCIVNLSKGLDLIPSRIENVMLDNEIINQRLPLDKFYSNLFENIEDNYDFIFIDCPPTMGQAVSAASLYSDVVLAPLNPDKYSEKGLRILQQEIATLNRIHKKNIDYKVFLNKFSSKTILSDKAIMTLVSDPSLEGRVLSTTIQYSQELPNITDENRNVFKTLKKSSVRNDFNLLALELLEINAEMVRDGNKSKSQPIKKNELSEEFA